MQSILFYFLLCGTSEVYGVINLFSSTFPGPFETSSVRCFLDKRLKIDFRDEKNNQEILKIIFVEPFHLTQIENDLKFYELYKPHLGSVENIQHHYHQERGRKNNL